MGICKYVFKLHQQLNLVIYKIKIRVGNVSLSKRDIKHVIKISIKNVIKK